MRWKKGNGVFYAYRASGPWFDVEPPCAPLGIEDDWTTHRLVMIDCETTGIDWTKDHLVEVGLVAGRLVPNMGADRTFSAVVNENWTFCELVQPPESAKDSFEEAKKAHGIEWEEARKAAPLRDVLERLGRLLDAAHDKGALLCAYNADFDHRFIAGSFIRVGLEVPALLRSSQGVDVLDPAQWSRALVDDHLIDEHTEATGDVKELLDPMQWSRGLVPKYTKGGHKLEVVARRTGVWREEYEGKTHRADFDALLALHVLAHFANQVPREYSDLICFQRAARAHWADHFFGDYLPRKHRYNRIQALIDKRLAEMGAGSDDEDDEGLAAFLELSSGK